MPAPKDVQPPKSWSYFKTFELVKEAVWAVPSHFETRTTIEGIRATDLHTLNTSLGASIEDQVVATLNKMRAVWDPNAKLQTFAFQRQAQVFPDVLLRSDKNGKETILGIELKGWYLLSKESEPNFRFTTTANACAEADLLVIVPWALSNVVSGIPIVFKPFIVSAKFAALYRNYHWQEIRTTKSESGITSPTGVAPYPKKADKIADIANNDGGSNFGRIARTGLLDDFVKECLKLELSGIAINEWVEFLKRFQQ